ncbi:ABC transporter permease [Chelatococcus sp. GCM10030263]|uniref:ABC transporter permease n=1 Tax=Chelatococcus sp. GCM10030263 TaxID=3273387 RepID=UPI003607BA07
MTRTFGGTVMLLAAGAYLAAFYLLPIGDVLWRSFGNGGEAYAAVLSSPATLRVLTHTVFFAFEVTLFSLALGLPIAYIAWQSPPSRAALILLIASLPLWTSLLVRTFAWQGILGRGGVLAWMLSDLFGMSDVPRMSNNSFGALVGSVYVMVPYMVMALYASFRSIDARLFSAARTLGSGRTQAFVGVFLPLATPGISSGCLLVFILSVGFFVPPALLGGPQDQTVAMLIAQRVNVRGNFEEAAALSVLLLATIFAILGLMAGLPPLLRRLFREPGEQAGRSFAADAAAWLTPLRPLLRPLESRLLWQIMVVVVLAVLLLPFVVIVPLAFSAASYIQLPVREWSLRWFEQVADSRLWLEAAGNSILIAVVAASIAVLVGVAAAIGLRGRGASSARVLFALFMAPAILPVIVYAIGAFFLAARASLVDTRTGLMIAHSVLGLPFVLITVSTALATMPSNLEGAARTLGAGPPQVLARITLPLVTPAIVTGAIMAFLASFDEVVVALFLSGVTSRTLPKELWQASTLQVSPVIMAVGLYIVAFMLLVAAASWVLRAALERRHAVPPTRLRKGAVEA